MKFISFLPMKERRGETDNCYPTFEAAPSDENIFQFCTSNFFTDDGCEHAKMKQFTLVAGNIRSAYTLNRLIYSKLQDLLHC